MLWFYFPRFLKSGVLPISCCANNPDQIKGQPNFQNCPCCTDRTDLAHYPDQQARNQTAKPLKNGSFKFKSIKPSCIYRLF